MGCRSCRMLREKVSSLEAKNKKLKKEIKERDKELVNRLGLKKDLISKSKTQKAIDKINGYCKQNDCSIKINNNGLIGEVILNKTFDYPDYFYDKNKEIKKNDT